MVRALAAGRPYEERNSKRLIIVAVAVVVAGVVAPLADAAARRLVVERLDAVGFLTARYEIALVPLLVAGALVVCAGALRRGATAEQEQPRVPAG